MFRYTLVINLVLLCCIIHTICDAQNMSQGFYIVLNQKKCTNNVPSLNKKEHWCLSERVFIGVDEFEVLPGIHYDSVYLEKFIALKLTPTGFNKWKTIIISLPDTKLALVIANKVAGTFSNNYGEEPHIIVPLRGSFNSKEIDWIYEQLQKESVTKEKKE